MRIIETANIQTHNIILEVSPVNMVLLVSGEDVSSGTDGSDSGVDSGFDSGSDSGLEGFSTRDSRTNLSVSLKDIFAVLAFSSSLSAEKEYKSSRFPLSVTKTVRV